MSLKINDKQAKSKGKTVKILQSLQHQIYVGNGSVGVLEDLAKEYADGQIVVLADENTYRHCYPLLPSGFDGKTIVIPAGEEHKNLMSATKVWEQLLHHKINRKGLIINLGGGVIGDLGGFCASVWKRGIDFIQVPTSLLAMVDASCGGKTGVNLNGIKNQIGTFSPPHSVIIDPLFLNTLPQREFLSGIAEMLKHAIISEDKSFYQQLSEIESPTIENISPLIEQAIAIKNEIVLQDPKEKYLRRILNFGHTIGHAIETWSQTTKTPLLHGEAIALGMQYEIQLAYKQQLISRTTTIDYLTFIRKFFHQLTTELPPIDTLLSIMQHDKKNTSEAIFLVLPMEIGKTQEKSK